MVLRRMEKIGQLRRMAGWWMITMRRMNESMIADGMKKKNKKKTNDRVDDNEHSTDGHTKDKGDGRALNQINVRGQTRGAAKVKGKIVYMACMYEQTNGSLH